MPLIDLKKENDKRFRSLNKHEKQKFLIDMINIHNRYFYMRTEKEIDKMLSRLYYKLKEYFEDHF